MKKIKIHLDAEITGSFRSYGNKKSDREAIREVMEQIKLLLEKECFEMWPVDEAEGRNCECKIKFV